MDTLWVAKEIKKYKPFLLHNAVLNDIFEGNLLEYVLADLKKQLNAKAYEQIEGRVIPINVLRRVIDKLSKIFSEPPSRMVNNGKDADQKAVEYYSKILALDAVGAEVCSFFNLFKWSCYEPYLHKGIPRVRSVPSDRFLFLSNDPVDPTSPTHWAKLMGYHEESKQAIWHVYTDQEFQIINEDGEVLRDEMRKYGNEGVNEYGAIPAVYVNRSKHCIVPKPDSDTLSMTKIIPVMLTDLNFAVMYQSFSVIYGIDIDLTNITMSPNGIWQLKSDSTASDRTPQIGTIKPTVDIAEVTNFIVEVFSMWMETKNIKASSIGKTDNAISGFSKIIDEMDTSKERQTQVPVFAEAENKLFRLIANHMQPVWIKDPLYEPEMPLPIDIDVVTEFPEQKPDVSEGVKIDNAIKKLNAGLTTRELAVREANPELTEEQIDEIIAEVEAPEEEFADANEVDIGDKADLPNKDNGDLNKTGAAIN